MKKIKLLTFFLLLTYIFTTLTGCSTGFRNDGEKFEGNCGVAISADVVDNGMFPQLNIRVANTSTKDIYAVKIYVVPQDVYGEEVDTIFSSTNQIFIDKEIRVGETYSFNHTIANDSVKTVSLYLYSVFFEDQTEWGDREASYNTIMAYGRTISVNGRFE